MKSASGCPVCRRSTASAQKGIPPRCRSACTRPSPSARRLTIREGHSAIVDAVYARPGDRQAIEHVAADMAVPFVGIWLEAPEATLVARTEQRRNDPSDADADVIRLQQQQGTGVMTWHRLEASSSPDTVLKDAAQYVQDHVHGDGGR